MPPELRIVSVQDFVAKNEPGAVALLGSGPLDALIPEGGNLMMYGRGGASKTTLAVDGAMHLAAGDDWLEIPVERALRVLLIEDEGPRAMFRAKLKNKLIAWQGSPLEDRLTVLEEPWGAFTFADEHWRAALATAIREGQIDVLIVGPIVCAGMEENGTLQEVRRFMRLVQNVREQSGRRVAVILVHHANRGGEVSGMFGEAVDTLLHVESKAHGETTLDIEKARWSTERHGTKLELAWTDGGEGFAVEGSKGGAPSLAERVEAACEDTWLTAREIAEKVRGGKPAVEAILDDETRFEMRTGEAARKLNRSSTAKLYKGGPDRRSTSVHPVHPEQQVVGGLLDYSRRESRSPVHPPAPEPEGGPGMVQP